MAVMSDGCEPVEAAGGGDNAGPRYAGRGGHDGPIGVNLGALAFACGVLMDARSFRKALLWPLLDVSVMEVQVDCVMVWNNPKC